MYPGWLILFDTYSTRLRQMYNNRRVPVAAAKCLFHPREVGQFVGRPARQAASNGPFHDPVNLVPTQVQLTSDGLLAVLLP